MAFQVPALPSFQTNIPQMPSPLDQYGKMLQLRSLAGQQQMQPLQQQEAQQDVQQKQLQNQKMQMDMDSQKALRESIAGGVFNKFAGVDTPDGSGFDAAGAYRELLAKNPQILPEHAGAAVQSLLKIGMDQAEQRKTNAQAAEANATVRSKTLDSVAAKLGSIGDMPATKAGPALDAFHQDLVKNPKAYPGLTQQEMGQLYSSTLDHLDGAASLIGVEGKIADFHKSKAEATTAEQAVIPASGGLSPASQQGVQKDVAVATNPQIQAGKEQVAEATGRANALMQAEIARGSNAALANVPKELIAPATAAVTKAGEDYAQSKSVSDRLAAIMEAAKKGNVVSYQLLPEEGALQVVTAQGIHRINMAEIQNYGGGSAWQKLQGHIGKALTGKSIPDSVLGDMGDIQNIMAEGSRVKYANAVKVINQSYGSNYKPVDMETMKAPGAPPSGPPQGATHIGVGSLDKKKHYLDAQGKDLGPAE